jgi:hypothetical protein
MDFIIGRISLKLFVYLTYFVRFHLSKKNNKNVGYLRN